MSKNFSNRLEKNGVRLSTLGLGVEHFAKGVRKVKHLSREENSKRILDEAFKLGITHYDLVFDLPYFFEVFRDFIKDKRKEITFTSHIGNVFNEVKGTSAKSRSINKIVNSFDRTLETLETDYTDIGLLQYVRNEDDYKKVVKIGLIEYANELKETGRAKSIGISSHNPSFLLETLEKHEFDVVMTVINFATGVRETTRELIDECKKKNISLIAIKNLHKGKLFTTKQTELGYYYSGGSKIHLKLDQPATPAQCINYALDLGVDSVVFGVQTVEQLQEDIQSFREEKDVDYSHLVKIFNEKINSTV